MRSPQTNARIATLVEDTQAKTAAVHRMRDAIRQRAHSIVLLRGAADPFERDAEAQRYYGHARAFLEARVDWENRPLAGAEALLAKELRDRLRIAQPLNDRAVILLQSGGESALLDATIDAGDTAQIEVLGVLDELVALQARNSAAALAQSNAQMHATELKIIGLIAATLTASALVGWFVIATVRRKNHEITHQAEHDALTRLPNRAAFDRHLDSVLADPALALATLLFIDLDRFKLVNDSEGHAAGDQLLRELGERLSRVLLGGDLLARIGGDEFAIVSVDCDRAAGMALGERIRGVVERYRLLWEDREYTVGASVGVVTLERGMSRAEALKAADIACYAAKDAGRNRVLAYDQVRRESRNDSVRQNQLAVVLRESIAHNRFTLFAQPIVPIAARDLQPRYEILARLHAPNDRMVSPRAFVPIAERYGLMAEIDRWVVEAALRWLQGQTERVGRVTQLHINLSPQTIGDSRAIGALVDLLSSEVGLADRLCFEISERALEQVNRVRRVADLLRGLGCRFALDGFGSGKTSFGHLSRLPVDLIKIGTGVLHGEMLSSTNLTLLKSINDIVHALGRQSVAQFVESDAVLEAVRKVGVDFAQGVHLGVAQPLAQFSSRTNPGRGDLRIVQT